MIIAIVVGFAIIAIACVASAYVSHDEEPFQGAASLKGFDPEQYASGADGWMDF